LLAWTAGACLVLAGWAAIMLGLPLVGPSGRLVAVVGEPAVAATAVRRAGGRIVEIRGGVVLARSKGRDFAWRLYRSGASMVLEGRVAAGCLALAGQAGSAPAKAGA
jgi:hypothetical protein